MTIADILAIILGLALIGLGFCAFSLVMALVWPGAVERAARQTRNRPLASLFSGLGTLVAVLIATAVLMKIPAPPARLLALVLLLSALTLSAIGGSGLAGQLGARYRESVRADPSIKDVLRGAVLLESAVAFPVVGWFVLFPLAFLITLGAGLRSLLTPRPDPA